MIVPGAAVAVWLVFLLGFLVAWGGDRYAERWSLDTAAALATQAAASLPARDTSTGWPRPAPVPRYRGRHRR